MLERAYEFLVTYGLQVIGAIVILVAGRIIAGVLRRFTRAACERANVEPTLTNFSAQIVYWIVVVFAVLAALAKFGVQTASFVAVLGAAGFAVGFALQGSLANFAAGVMILAFRPFNVGDYIEAGDVAGTVKEIGIFTTVLATPDNIKIIVGNGQLFGSTIKNYSAFDTRRLDLAVGIGYGSDIGTAVTIIDGLFSVDDRVLRDPVHQVLVSELADSSVNLIGRVWVNRADYWSVKFDMTRRIKEACDAHGIEIPFPQRTVHMEPMAASA